MIVLSFSIAVAAVIGAAAACITLRRRLERQTHAADVIVALNGVLQTQVDELQLRARDFELLGEMSELLQVSTTVAEACDVLSAFGMALFEDFTGAVLITKGPASHVEAIACWGENPATDFATTDCWALRRGQAHIGSASAIRCLHARSADSTGGVTMCVPMLALGEGLGVVTISSTQPVIGADVERFAKSFADQIALAVANLRMQETLRTRAVRDALTGLYNRRYLDEALGREIVRAVRRQRQVGVVLIDVDHFKRFNDTHGHGGGDVLLQQFSRLMQAHAGDEDLVCRYGGEEFLIILPDVDVEALRSRAESLIESARLLRVHLDGEELSGITISAGLALSNERLSTAASLLNAADRALYNAKSSGRDRVVGPLPQIVGDAAA